MFLFKFFERGFPNFNRYVELLLQLSLNFFLNEFFSSDFGFRKFSVRSSSLLVLFPFLFVPCNSDITLSIVSSNSLALSSHPQMVTMLHDNDSSR